MRKIKYQFWEETSSNYLHYNAFSNQFLLLNKEKHEILETNSILNIKENMPYFYQTLLNNQFIVPDDFDEYEVTVYRKKQKQFDASMYQIMVNTTLDCNLNCWYCYENKISDSFLKEDVIEAIKKNIEFEYNTTRFNVLKVSFFGGEPFLDFNGIKEILSYAEKFCKERELDLIADFTTNATLITKDHIAFLKNFRCHFQIPIDGNRHIHNLVKKDKNQPIDTYQKTMDALHLIDSGIPNRWVAVRVNFDNRILRKIDEIIADIDFLNRQKSMVILKKVWQIPKNNIDTNNLHCAIQKFFDNKKLF